MPVLAVGGEQANGQVLGEQVKLVATESGTVVLTHCGLEEQPKAANEALLNFL